MSLQIVYYDLTNERSKELEAGLKSFKHELSAHIPKFSELQIVSGNEQFPDILEKLRTNLDPHIQKKIISGDDASGAIKAALPGTGNHSHLMIVLPSPEITFTDNPGAHGITNGGNIVLLKRTYKNIILHETAHLFGARDHYVLKSLNNMQEICTDKERCVMQWNPADKKVVFCSETIREIQDFLDGKPVGNGFSIPFNINS